MAWSIVGKTVVVTGGTSGIGEASAVALARMGAHLALVGRDPARGAAALAKVKAAGDASARLFLGDLSLQSEVRRLAGELDQALARIDVLINNAGALFTRRQTTAEGFERTFALNHLAYHLLTTLLLPKLRASAPARILNVSSDGHRLGKLDFDDLQSQHGYFGFRVYGTSKLANILFTRTLAKRLAGTGVTVNCLHPGTVASGFGRNNDTLYGTLAKWVAPLLRTPEKAAQTPVYLATAPELENVTGEYFVDSKRRTPSKRARDDADGERLFAESERMTG